jgi:Xaa-Pro dipeptidase
MLDPAFARKRQQRLQQLLHDRKLDAAVLGHPKHVYYFTAHLPFWQHHAGVVIFADGKSVLLTANAPNRAAAADTIRAFEATWNGTQRQEQPALVAGELRDVLAGGGAKRVGIDTSEVTAVLAADGGFACEIITPDLWQMRRAKDFDELSLMRKAIDCTGAMYERARQIIEPGVPELTVFNELHAAAVKVAGEPLSDFLGNDYACGQAGGPPRRDRLAAAGELYILDLGPAYRGYFADNARAFSVDRRPTDAQHRAWEIVTGVHPIVERMARPGVRCRDIFRAVDEYYLGATGKPFPHHLGHGVGLQPHEFPHLNPKWDDVLIEGEIFTVEPGLYSPELRGGMRIENQYLVKAEGVENLTPFPLELA